MAVVPAAITRLQPEAHETLGDSPHLGGERGRGHRDPVAAQLRLALEEGPQVLGHHQARVVAPVTMQQVAAEAGQALGVALAVGLVTFLAGRA